jgi:5-(carboxyamino)imidazole ribonucleotide mutase
LEYIQQMSPRKRATIEVAVIMGSRSDLPVMREAVKALREFGLKPYVQVLSAHRTPEEVIEFSRTAQERGFRVIIAGAGGAAHLPGMVAAVTPLPVIGVPVGVGPLRGQDALFSIVQMPRGVPVATVAIDNAYNAGVLAAQILSVSAGREDLAKKVAAYKARLRAKVKKAQI